MSDKKVRPEYVLVISERDNTKNKTIAGAAFKNKFGGLSLALNPGVFIDMRVRDTCWITLVPYEDASVVRRAAVEGLEEPQSAAKSEGEVPIS